MGLVFLAYGTANNNKYLMYLEEGFGFETVLNLLT
jgi:hypothetical protein